MAFRGGFIKAPLEKYSNELVEITILTITEIVIYLCIGRKKLVHGGQK